MVTQEGTIFIAYVVICIIVAIILFFFLANTIQQGKKYQVLQREKLAAEIIASEKERNNIATELHNDLGPYLVSIKTRLHLIESAQKEQIEACCESLSKCVQMIREVTKELSPISLYGLGFQEAIKQYVESYEVQQSLKIEIEELTYIDLSPEQNNHLYRIMQEIIHNAVKHSKGSAMKIEVSKEGESLMLIRTFDNGIGFNPTALKKQGNGLLGIQSRIEYLKGTIQQDLSRKTGTRYNIRIPL